MLTICKRLGPQGDPTAEANRKILDMMYDDIWLHKLSLSEFVHKILTQQMISQHHRRT